MEKITALKKTIYNLENDVYHYDWCSFESCNCGVLAKTITGSNSLVAAGFLDSPTQNRKYEAFCSYAYCITTKLELPLVFQSLKDSRFTIGELNGLENLNGKNIVEKTGKLSRTNKDDVIKYLKAWVEILEEEKPQIQPEQPKEKTIIKYVAVSQTINESLPETILS